MVPSPSPSHAADGGHADPPLAQMQQQRPGDGGSEETPAPPHSTSIVVSSAAKYVPPRAADRTADPGGDDRSWYSWNGGRTKDRHRHRPPPPPQRPQPQPQPLPQLRPQPQPKPRPPPELPPRAAVPPAPAPAPIPTRSVERDRRVMPDIISRKRPTAALQRSALVARAAAAGLCLAALAVLAADSRKGWTLDSYSNYTQLRYSEAVNVIGFLYSVFQFFALGVLLRRNRPLIPRPNGDYFDFIMDQVLAYLLISSSSSATARVGDWIDNWGSDPFPNMANSSIAISFLAFLVFAINSLISAYNLFRRDL